MQLINKFASNSGEQGKLQVVPSFIGDASYHVGGNFRYWGKSGPERYFALICLTYFHASNYISFS